MRGDDGPLAAAYQQFCVQLSHAMRYKILRENDNIVQTISSKLVYPLFLYNERSSSSCIVDMKNEADTHRDVRIIRKCNADETHVQQG